MILIASVGNFLDKPLVTVILPVYAKTFYGSPTSLGLALGAFGAGALTGSLLFGAVGRGWPRRLTLLGSWVLGPLVIFGTLALTALAQAGIPIGAVLAGVVVQRAGLVPTILGMGVLYLLVPLGMFFNRSLLQMDTQRRRDAPGPAPAVE